MTYIKLGALPRLHRSARFVSDKICRITSSHTGSGDSTRGLLDADDGGETGGGGEREASFVHSLPAPHRRRLQRLPNRDLDENSHSPAPAATAAAASSLSSSGCSSSSSGASAAAAGGAAQRGGGRGAGGGGGPGLFVPLLGTRLDSQARGLESMRSGGGGDEYAAVDAGAGGGDGGAPSEQPSRFAWTWMGLRPADTPAAAATTAAAAMPRLPGSPALVSGRPVDHQQRPLPREARGEGGNGSSAGLGLGAGGGGFGLPRLSSSSSSSSSLSNRPVLSPPSAHGAVPAAGGDDAEWGPLPASPGSRFSSGRDGTESGGAAFGEGVDSLGRPLPRPARAAAASSSYPAASGWRGTATGGGGDSLSSGFERRPRSLGRAPLPSAAAVATDNPSPPSRAAAVTITGTSAGVGGGGVGGGRPRVRRLRGRHVVNGEGEEKAVGGYGGSAAPFAVAGEERAQGYRASSIGVGGVTGGGGGGGRGRFEDLASGGEGAGASVRAPLSSPTSSSSFSLNGFEVIDKDEDMWN